MPSRWSCGRWARAWPSIPVETAHRRSGHLALTPADALSHTFPAMQKPPENSDPNAPNAVAQFEQSLDELESLVQRMEKGDLSLDDSLAAYERGVGLYRRCQTALEQAELRVRLLTDPLDPDGAEPFHAPE